MTDREPFIKWGSSEPHAPGVSGVRPADALIAPGYRPLLPDEIRYAGQNRINARNELTEMMNTGRQPPSSLLASYFLSETQLLMYQKEIQELVPDTEEAWCWELASAFLIKASLARGDAGERKPQQQSALHKLRNSSEPTIITDPALRKWILEETARKLGLDVPGHTIMRPATSLDDLAQPSRPPSRPETVSARTPTLENIASLTLEDVTAYLQSQVAALRTDSPEKMMNFQGSPYSLSRVFELVVEINSLRDPATFHGMDNHARYEALKKAEKMLTQLVYRYNTEAQNNPNARITEQVLHRFADLHEIRLHVPQYEDARHQRGRKRFRLF